LWLFTNWSAETKDEAKPQLVRLVVGCGDTEHGTLHHKQPAKDWLPQAQQ